MTEGIVDVLKSIKVKEQKSHLVFLPAGTSQCFRHPISKESAIRQARQSIIVSKELHSFVGDFSIGDVAKIPDSASVPSVRIDERCRVSVEDLSILQPELIPAFLISMLV